MRILRTLPTTRLLALVGAVVAVLVAGAAIALGAAGGGPTPPAKPLAQAVHDALAAPAPAGVTARIRFTNNLLPTGGALTGQIGSALITGASGRLWATADGRGRLELQSDAGDVQIVWSRTLAWAYDASSNTVYRIALPAAASSGSNGSKPPPTVSQITSVLTQLSRYWTVGSATPTDVGGQPAYDVRATPKTSAGLLGALEVAWDATHGVPLELSVYARGSSAPVLQLAVTSVSFGAVPSSDVDISPPAGAHVVDLPTPSGNGAQKPTEVTGLAAVQAALPFQVAAPATLGGLSRSEVRLVGHGDAKGALVVYGEGLGAVAVFEHAADATSGPAGPMGALPSVTIAGAAGHELSTPLGTAVTWQRGGVAYVLAGSVTAAVAEADAAALA